MNERATSALLWAVAVAAMVAALLAPALWNGFPLVFSDTGGYLARPFEGRLEFGRSATYGAFLAAGINLDFWPNVVAQALVVVWLVALTLRMQGIRPRPLVMTALVLGLCGISGVSWYASQLMPDILVPAAVLAMALLAFGARSLRRWEIAGLMALIAFSIASHMSILALTLGLALALVALALLARWLEIPRPSIGLPAAAVLGGVLFAPLSNLAIVGEFKFTPGGDNFIFSRLVQDGIVQRYLADRCPDAAIKLCDYRAEMPATAEEWLWSADGGVLRKLGEWPAFEAEARHIMVDTLRLYPGLHLKTALRAWGDQLVAVGTGDGLASWTWHTQMIMETFGHAALPHYMAARQRRLDFDFRAINAIQVPIGLAAMVALVAIPFAQRRVGPSARAFALFTLIALLGNAAICGVFSGAYARYQGRLLPIAPLGVAVALLGWRKLDHRVDAAALISSRSID